MCRARGAGLDQRAAHTHKAGRVTHGRLVDAPHKVAGSSVPRALCEPVVSEFATGPAFDLTRSQGDDGLCGPDQLCGCLAQLEQPCVIEPRDDGDLVRPTVVVVVAVAADTAVAGAVSGTVDGCYELADTLCFRCDPVEDEWHTSFSSDATGANRAFVTSRDKSLSRPAVED